MKKFLDSNCLTFNEIKNNADRILSYNSIDAFLLSGFAKKNPSLAKFLIPNLKLRGYYDYKNRINNKVTERVLIYLTCGRTHKLVTTDDNSIFYKNLVTNELSKAGDL